MLGSSMAVKLTHIPKFETLSPLVFRVLGCNPGPMTLQGTNTYLVGAGKEKILVDTGSPNIPEYLLNLQEALKSHLSGARISQIICTHWHYDHVGGARAILQQGIASDVQVFKFPRGADEELEFAPGGRYQFVQDGHLFQAQGASLRTVFTPGHTQDHISLWLEEEGAIFSGDCILGEGTTVFEDYHSYMKSLELILGMKPGRIYPGHGPLIHNGIEKIEEYIAHRQMREMQILGALQTADEPLKPEDIVSRVYEGVPEALVPAAAANVTHHLTKLLKDGRVVQKEDGWLPIKEHPNP